MGQEQEIRTEDLLNLPRDEAFELVVDNLETWWTSPFEEAGPMDAGIEPFAGGVCYEIGSSGRRRIWGTVLSMQKPLYIRLAWQVSAGKEQIPDPATASRVMISFRAVGQATRIEIIHSEFLRHGQDGADYLSEMRGRNGWPRMIANLKQAANSSRR
ncbi:hypothetical protein E1180_17425 [Roseibium denhamense]|nr:hypothetical protein [Roseibium denhamense]